MSRYALVDGRGRTVNVIVWDGVTPVDFGGLTPVVESKAPAYEPAPEPKAEPTDIDKLTAEVVGLREALVKKGAVTRAEIAAERPVDIVDVIDGPADPIKGGATAKRG